MTTWDEIGLSEDPAVELLQTLGYDYAHPDALTAERDSLRDTVLVGRLEKALRKLNPWIDDGNVHKAVRAVTGVATATLLEANEELTTVLTRGITLQQNLGENRGRDSQSVHYIDFDDPRRNEFLVTRQFRVKGAKTTIIPDLVVFVNGVPLVVIECKSPTVGELWKHEAIDQLRRYQELDERHRLRGAPRLFHTVQLTVATCGQDARFGTVGTPERRYLRWRDPHPLSLADVEADLGRSPTPQDVLLYGLLRPENLLDLIRHFVVFENDATTGRKVRKVARYNQFKAVDKTLSRVRSARQAEDRGGVVWHTQGSGKSLTMLWLALKLRDDPSTENPTLVIVTDRRQLDQQITKTFHACGYPTPERAESVEHLRRLLAGPGGRTVMTTVQKFQEAGGVDQDGRPTAGCHPVLTGADNVFVMTDEAHRTQYGSLAGNLRLALPNAVFIGFTGTPIDKQDRSTLSTFGPYIDRYTVQQAVADEATVEIRYEGRLPELRVVGQSLDRLFERVFADCGPEEREAIKSRWATERAVAEAPKRIEMICLDLVDHYQTRIEPGGFKAQVVAPSREAAVAYKETLDRIHAPESAVVVSEDRNDSERLARWHTTEGERERLVDRFKDPDDPLRLLVVCDMLLTGFDAPIEQAMYLDAPLREHTLLQAIARVNRTCGETKTYGLVVDYWGVSEALQEALSIFAPGDVEGVMAAKSDELPRLQARHAAALRFFTRVRDKGDLDACVAVLEPEDVRAEFQLAFRRFSRSMDLLLPDPRAMDYAADLRWLGKIRQAAAARFRQRDFDLAECGEKVRRLIEDAIVAEGIEILVREVSIFSGDFQEKLDALATDEAKASEMEHGIRHEIHVRLEENPAFYRTLRERLEKIIEERKARRIDAARQLELLGELLADLRGASEIAQDAGLSETAYAIYGLLDGDGHAGTLAEPALRGTLDPAAAALAELVEETVRDSVGIVDWVHKDDVQREMRRRIKRQLAAAKRPPADATRTARRIVDLLKVREGR